ncbi:MAG: DUF3575 domain-containing protein [Muribaculaceae bacterium]|nr:DUF3575 domain-containing protein [Muribaculaceae bacterium]
MLGPEIGAVTVSDSLRVRLHYRCGSSVIDSAFNANDSAIVSLRRLANAPESIHAVSIVSSASPEGTAQYNNTLSARRSQAALDLLTDIFGHDSVPVCVTSIGVDYRSLRERLGTMPLSSIYSSLRVSEISISYTTAGTSAQKPHTPLPALTVPAPHLPDRVVIAPASALSQQPKGNHFALSTNLLYDALAIPTLGVHMILPRHIVVGLSGMYAWWGGARQGRYWRAQGCQLFLRHYLSDSDLISGHHIGLYGEVLRYDFSFGSRGQLSGDSGAPFDYHPTWCVGADYGYSFRLNDRLRLDLSVGIGYMTGHYLKYRITDGHSVWQSSQNRRYLGPTKAEASIIWIIGKGGCR